MKRITLQCQFKDIECFCPKKEKVRIYRSPSDFYEGFDLFICPSCQSMFGLDKESFKYEHKELKDVLKGKSCHVCKGALQDILDYPQHYFCPSSKEVQMMDNYTQMDFSKDSIPIQVYDLLS